MSGIPLKMKNREYLHDVKNRFKNSITFKNTVLNSLLFSIVLLLFFIAIAASNAKYVFYGTYINIQEHSQAITAMLSEENLSNNFLEKYANATNISITIYDEAMNKVAQYGKPLKMAKTTFTYKENNNCKVNIDKNIEYSLDTQINNKKCTIVIMKSLEGELKYFGIILTTLTVGFFILLILVLVIGSVNLRNMLRSIHFIHEQQNRFVSDVSHELRTPLHVIQGYADLLDRWGKDDRKVLEEVIVSLKNESKNMIGLVESLLFLAHIDSDKNAPKIEKAYFYIDELISEIVKDMQMIDKEHTYIIVPFNHMKIFGDIMMIRQALRIIFDNCKKYTQENGSIIIEVKQKNNAIQVIISDNGIGIGKEDLPFVFDRFYKADKSRNRTKGGSGLGLPIAKWIVESHEGSISIESNVGTTVTIILPTP